MNSFLSCSLALVLCASPATACATDGAPTSVPIADYDPQTDEDVMRNARFQITIHSGAGIPGTPGAGEYYRQPKRVLQSIVDTCELGATIYIVATDGVSVLKIVNDALSDTQVACIRSAEANGLYLTDRGASQ